MILSILVLLANLALADPTTTAIAPWYHAEALLKATLGSDPCLTVQDLESTSDGNVIKIKSCSKNKAVALASLLDPKQFIGVRVLLITDQNQIAMPSKIKKSEELAKAAEIAFNDNSYYTRIYASNSSFSYVTIEFKPAVVQYASDDISDFHGMTNRVAQEAFCSFLIKDFSAKLRLACTTQTIAR